MPDLHAIVKAYDIRGIVPDQLDDRVAYALGAATVDVLAVKQIVTAHDMRDSGPALSSAFATGAARRLSCGTNADTRHPPRRCLPR